MAYLDELSSTVSKNANVLSQYLASNGLPQPSFRSDGPSTVLPSSSPENIQQARQDLISASLNILHLAIGPSEFLPNLATGFQYVSCLQWLCQYKIFHLVPLEHPISYSSIATAANLPESRLKAIMRMAMTSTLFTETSDGQHVNHSATSAFLARNDDAYAYATYMGNKSALMAMHMAAAHGRWGPETTRTHETAYNVAFNTDLTFFDHLARDEDRTREFANYMRNVRSSEGVSFKHLIAGFNWQDIVDGGVVVDVGGSTGGAAIALAKAFPRLNFIVQDVPGNADDGRKAAQSLPEDVASRLTFQGHDFTNPQPVQGADIYLLRMILHDWPDEKAIAILKNIVTAMDRNKTASRLLIMDTVLPSPGSEPISAERLVRVRDLTMLQAFNSKERDLEDWESLFAAAHPDLRLVGVVQPFGSTMSVLELSLGFTA